jgi:hypothetical protein
MGCSGQLTRRGARGLRVVSHAVGWDPRQIGEDSPVFRLRPVRVQAYRGYDELEGRDVMRDGDWLV